MKICQPSGCRPFLSHAPKAEVLECRLFWAVRPLRRSCGSAVPLRSRELCSAGSCGTEGSTPAASVRQALLSESPQLWLQPPELEMSHEVFEGSSERRKSRQLRVDEGVHTHSACEYRKRSMDRKVK